MRLSLWMIVNRLDEMEVETHIKNQSRRMLRSARLAHATNCAYVYQRGNDVICSDEDDYILIRNIEKNVAFEVIQGIFDFYNSWSEELDLILENENKSELIQVLWKVFQNPMILFNASQTVSAMTRQYGYGEVDEEWDYLLRYGSSSGKGLKTIHSLEKPIAHKKELIQKISIQKNKLITPYLSCHIVKNNIRLGQIVILENERELNPGDMELLKYAVRQIEKRIRISMSDHTVKLQMHVLLDLILEKPLDWNELERQMMQLGWKKEDQYRVLIAYVEKDGVDRERHLNLIYNAIHSFFSAIGCITYEDKFIMIMNDSIQDPQWTRPNVLRIMEENYGVITGGYGISGIENIRFSYQQALWAYKRGKYNVNGKKRYDYFSSALDYLVQCMWAEKKNISSILYSCHPDVIKLWKMDLETEGFYIDTLAAFLQNERSPAVTSNALHIHRSTLVYRIKKLEELMESDLFDSYNREYILNSIRILKHFTDEIPYMREIHI